ncbi:signal peptidase II [Candidatus Palauibacter sp.]|uniref:signal peptidase II n=1 Tax=Candidatus Palauibacter sp. TaxID=3101350 RepID=UPI003C6F5EF3
MPADPSERVDGPTPDPGLPGAPGTGIAVRLWLTLIPIAVVLTLDVMTKAWVMNTFELYEQAPVIGDFFRFTYTHNRGAAFGLDIGEHSRIFFLLLSLIALGVLGFIYRGTPSSDRLRVLAISLVAAGAIGNIWDRIRLEQGVVDFLDFGIGIHRFPVFNIADSGVTVGAVLLLISFWLEGRREAREAAGAVGTDQG